MEQGDLKRAAGEIATFVTTLVVAWMLAIIILV